MARSASADRPGRAKQNAEVAVTHCEMLRYPGTLGNSATSDSRSSRARPRARSVVHKPIRHVEIEELQDPYDRMRDSVGNWGPWTLGELGRKRILKRDGPMPGLAPPPLNDPSGKAECPDGCKRFQDLPVSRDLGKLGCERFEKLDSPSNRLLGLHKPTPFAEPHSLAGYNWCARSLR